MGIIKNVRHLGFLTALVAFAACSAVAEPSAITNYEQCVSAGNKILRTFPPRCVTADGLTFTESAAVPGELALGTPALQKSLCIDKCGNGECEQIVCLGTGCPCAENHEKCPKDCAD